jgi:hypothetical protein
MGRIASGPAIQPWRAARSEGLAVKLPHLIICLRISRFSPAALQEPVIMTGS